QQISKQLEQYEVSAYAAQQQQSQHNINYWQFGDYIGIGAGAHGKLTNNSGQITRSWKRKQPRDFMKHAGTDTAIGGDNTVIANELPFEYMMNTLRLKSGFSLEQFSNRTGLNASIIQPTLTRLLNKELLQLNQSSYTCTEQGWNFLNNTLEYFLPAE
ncbi:MAG TPA: YggW family oxidoreductase, partial [Cycloclasticus sp.]|nr:YggW family oxidoreductase [Cycloclasticus sp.]